MRSVPGIPRWLLMHFGSGANNDVIMGDLAERYRLGRSRTWYWRQVLATILTSLFNECCENKLLTARALIVGWVLARVAFPWSFDLLLREPLWALEVWSRHWRHGWILPLSWTLYAAVFCMMCGWLLARFHRPHQASMVLAFTLSYCCVIWPLTFLALAEGTRWWPAYVIPILGPASILLGGGLLHPREHQTTENLN